MNNNICYKKEKFNTRARLAFITYKTITNKPTTAAAGHAANARMCTVFELARDFVRELFFVPVKFKSIFKPFSL